MEEYFHFISIFLILLFCTVSLSGPIPEDSKYLSAFRFLFSLGNDFLLCHIVVMLHLATIVTFFLLLRKGDSLLKSNKLKPEEDVMSRIASINQGTRVFCHFLSNSPCRCIHLNSLRSFIASFFQQH